MAETDAQPTAQSILTALLLTPTHFILHPSLASLRAALDQADSKLSNKTDDAQLKLALREIVSHRRGVVAEVEESVARYKLLPKERRRAQAKDDSDEEPNAPSTALPLADVLKQLAEEEARLTASLESTEAELQRTKSQLESSARRIERLDIAGGGDGVSASVDARLSSLEGGVRSFEQRVRRIDQTANGDAL